MKNRKINIKEALTIIAFNIVLLMIVIPIYFLNKSTFMLLNSFYLVFLCNLLFLLLLKARIKKDKMKKNINLLNIFTLINFEDERISYFLRKIEIMNEKSVDIKIIDFFEKVEKENKFEYYSEIIKEYDDFYISSIFINYYIFKEKNDDNLLSENKSLIDLSIEKNTDLKKNNENFLFIFIGIIISLIFVLLILYGGILK
jgi:hypothetical protein